MRVVLVFLWIMLMVAPLIAEKKPHSAMAKNERPLAQQHADTSIYDNKVGIRGGATDGKLP
jgi:hypothetical protein